MKAASGSHDEFERLAIPLFDSLYNFARWLSHDDSEAEDLVQEAYAKALRGFGSFEPGTDFRAWIFRILRKKNLQMFARLTPDEWQCFRVHSERGKMTVEDLVRQMPGTISTTLRR